MCVLLGFENIYCYIWVGCVYAPEKLYHFYENMS